MDGSLVEIAFTDPHGRQELVRPPLGGRCGQQDVFSILILLVLHLHTLQTPQVPAPCIITDSGHKISAALVFQIASRHQSTAQIARHALLLESCSHSPCSLPLHSAPVSSSCGEQVTA